MPLKQRKFEYKWVILAACFLMVFFCLGFCSSTKSLYLDVITKALDIPRTLFAFNDSCRFISSAIINLFFGTFLYRFGVRKMTAFGFICLIASMLTYAYANQIYIFYIGGILLGIGLTFTTTTMASSVIRRWFTKDIGKYTGIVFAANGIGGAVAAQVLSPLIENEENIFGYRDSYKLVALLLLIVGTVIVLLLKEHPKDAKIDASTTKVKKARGSSWVGIDFQTAKTKPYFWAAAVVVLLTGFSLQGISGVYKAHMRGIGLDPQLVTNIASIYSLCLTVSKIVVGAIYDRFNLRKVMLICQSSAVVAFLILAFLKTSGIGVVFAFAYALFFALAMPLETLVIPLIANDLFGTASYDKCLGFLIAMNYTGYALGAPIVNLCYDVFGTYVPILLILSVVTVITGTLFQFVISASNKVKQQILESESAKTVSEA